jgi:hypothetical protein
MAIPYIQPSMASVRCVDGTYVSYPFIEDGDPSKVYNLVCTQQATDYNASQVALDTTMSSAAAAGVLVLPFPADNEAFFVGDTGHAPAGGGMISFTRTFANIPESLTVTSGSAFVTFAGIAATVFPAAAIAVSSLAMTSGTRGVTLTTGTAHGLSAGSRIYLSMDYTVDSDAFIHHIAGQFFVIDAPTTTTFRVDIGHYWSSQVTLTLNDALLRQVNVTRPPTSRNVSTETRYDYILPGVTPGISSALDIEVPPSFYAISSTSGEPVDTLTQTTTVPTYFAYNDMVKDGNNIVIESSLAEWAGNILVMKTKTCKAK